MKPTPASDTRSDPSDEGNALLRAHARLVLRHRRLVIFLLLLCSAAFAIGLPSLRFEVDPDRNLPADHPAILALEEMHARFGDKNLVVIGLFPKDGQPFAPAFLAKVDEITDQIGALPGVIPMLLQSIASPSMEDVQPFEDGILVEPLMEEVPKSPEEALAVRERVFRNPDFIDTLVAGDGSAVAIYATFDLTEELPAYEALYAKVRDLVAATQDGTFEFALSGPVVLAGALGLESGRVVNYLPLALLLIGLIHYHAFRTLQAIFLPLLTAILALLWAMGFMGLADAPLDPFTTTTPIVILAVAAGHAVQILKRYYEEFARTGDNETAVIESIARVGPVMVAAGAIAGLAFLSLATFGLPTIRTFGLFASLGIFATLVIELTLIPAVRAMLPPPGVRESQRESEGHAWLDAVLERLSRTMAGRGAAPTVAIACVLIAVSIFLALRIQVDTSFKRLFSPGTSVHDEDERLNRQFAGTSTLIFLVEGPEEDSLLEPEALNAIARFEKRMEALPGVGKALSITDRLGRLHAALKNDPSEPLPTTARLAAQELLLYEMSGGNELSTLITPDNRIAKVVVLLRDDSTRYGLERMADARAILAEELPSGFDVRIAGTLASNEALTEVMVRGKLTNILQIGIVAVAVASLLLRSLLAGLLVAVPLALAVAVDFGVMGALGIPLDVVTAPFAALSVGIGADYAVYFLFRLREEVRRQPDFAAALRETYFTSGKAIVFVASAITAGYLSLCVSGFSVHVRLSALVALAMVASSVGSLTVLPALTTLLSRTRWGPVR